MINVLSPEHLIIKTIHPFSTNLLPNPWSSSSLQRYHYYSKKTISVTDINLLLAPQALFGNLGERALTEIPDYTISKLEVPSENLD
ncbi:hypothetical protein FACS1894166_12210 [Bacilli bacterium]|nr:hypothetical protein FACS1894166_12210 [Bacilli bacterium]